MANQPIIIEEVIAKWFHGQQLSVEEQTALDDWCDRSKRETEFPEVFPDREWLRVNKNRINKNTASKDAPFEKMWKKVEVKVCEDLKEENPDPVKEPDKHRRLQKWMAMSVLIPLLVMGAWVYFRSKPVVLSKSVPPTTNVAENYVRRTRTDRSLLTKEILPDGTKVSIGAGSSVEVVYSASFRRVKVEGRALFDVAKDVHRPFVLEVNKNEVEVLGTSFTVESGSKGLTGHLILLSGAVNIKGGGEVLKMRLPGERVGFEEDKLGKMDNVDPRGAGGWADEKEPYWFLEGASMQYILEQLAVLHRVVIYNPDHLAGQALAGTLRMKRPLADNVRIINNLEWPYAHLELRGDTISITKPLANQKPAIEPAY